MTYISQISIHKQISRAMIAWVDSGNGTFRMSSNIMFKCYFQRR